MLFRSADGITSDNTQLVVGTGVAGATISVYVDGVLAGTTTVDNSGNWSFTTAALADGPHAIVAAQTVSGVLGLPTSPVNVTIDTAGPATPLVTSVGTDTGVQGDRVTADNTLTVTGIAEPGSTVKVYDNGVLVGTAVADATGNYSVTTSVLADGQHPLAVTATDVAGNESAPTSIGTWTIDTRPPAAPTITGVGTDTGASAIDKITSDNTLTITGTAEPEIGRAHV